MAASGYEFYLRVLKVSLTSERSEKAKRGNLLHNACHRNVLKLGYKVIKEK